MTARLVRVAALQASPALLDREATLERLDTWAEKAKDPDGFLYRGGSAVIAPDGRYLAGPVYDEETLVVADCDLGEITRESMTLDVSGHYSRPDVFEFMVRGRD